MNVALGLRAHSGWAMLVAVAGPARPLELIVRRRIQLADGTIPGSKQPYHTAAELEPKWAEKLVDRCIRSSRRLAGRAIEDAVERLRQQGHAVVGCGVLLGSGRTLPPLAATLASHALIHAAEGEFFRDALVRAGEDCGLPVTGVKEREILTRAAADLQMPADEVRQELAAIGKRVGPPWTQDEKLAALAAWVSLAAIR